MRRHAAKVQRYRPNKNAAGMKLLRIWVPDPNAPGFAAEARREAEILRGASVETGLRVQSQVMVDKVFAVPGRKSGPAIGLPNEIEMREVGRKLSLIVGVAD